MVLLDILSFFRTWSSLRHWIMWLCIQVAELYDIDWRADDEADHTDDSRTGGKRKNECLCWSGLVWKLLIKLRKPWMWYGENLVFSLSCVYFIGHKRDFRLADSMKNVARLSRVRSICAFEAFTTCCYIGVVIVVMNKIASHIVLTSKDTINYIA